MADQSWAKRGIHLSGFFSIRPTPSLALPRPTYLKVYLETGPFGVDLSHVLLLTSVSQ
jgi:hypothetical protein